MFKKLSYKLLPYIVALCTGFFIYYFAVEQNGEIKDLLINISAAFFAIHLIYLFYEIIKFFFHKKLRKEIFDYIKMQIDREVLSILNQLQKTIFPLGEKRPFSNKVVNDTLSLNSREIQGIIKSNKYLGFKILKKGGDVDVDRLKAFRNKLANEIKKETMDIDIGTRANYQLFDRRFAMNVTRH